jgi:hypothetical protein
MRRVEEEEKEFGGEEEGGRTLRRRAHLLRQDALGLSALAEEEGNDF